MILILTMFMSSNCGAGTSICGYELQPSDTLNTAFVEVVAHDSTTHWYIRLYEGENWCYLHNRYEEVKSVRR